MNIQKIKYYFFRIIFTYLIGALVAGILMFIIFFDFEIIPAAFIGSIFLLPSIFLYLICEYRDNKKFNKKVGFFVPLFGEVMYFLTWYLIGSVNGGGEGTELNLLAALLLIVVGFTQYYFLSKYEKLVRWGKRIFSRKYF